MPAKQPPAVSRYWFTALRRSALHSGLRFLPMPRLASTAQQKAWLALFDDPDQHVPRGQNLKSWLLGGEAISTSVALFDLASYKGRIVSDLFAEGGFFGDADEFFAAQRAAVEARKAAYLADDWSDVVILDRSAWFYSYDYEKMSKRKGGRVYAAFARSGEVVFHEGYVTKKEAQRVSHSGTSVPEAKAARPEVSAAMNSYIDLHRHAAVRSALAGRRDIALRVMVAHAVCGSPLWSVKAQDQRSHNDAVDASVAGSAAEAAFGERRRAVLGLLGLDEDEPTLTQSYLPRLGLAALFTRLMALPDAAVMDVMAVAMAETLASGSELIERLGLQLGVDMADYWQADEAFFGLLRDREILTQMLDAVGGTAVAQAHVGEPVKLIRSVIGDCLTGANDRRKVERWVPRWMVFPPAAYSERGGVGTVSAAQRALWQIEDGKPVAAAAGEGGTAPAEALAEETERLAA